MSPRVRSEPSQQQRSPSQHGFDRVEKEESHNAVFARVLARGLRVHRREYDAEEVPLRLHHQSLFAFRGVSVVIV